MVTNALLACIILSHGVFGVPTVVEGNVFHHSSDVQETRASDDSTAAKVGEVHYYNTNPLQTSLRAMSDRAYGQADRRCECMAEVFDHSGFHGRQLSILQQNSDFTNDFFNDRVESIKAVGKCRWIFYEHTNFLGRTHILSVGYYSSAPSWGGHGNQISSGRALPKEGSISIALFQHTNYQGRMLVLTASSKHLPNQDFNDAVSSILVLGGEWRLYEHDQFQGRHVTLGRGEYPNIHSSHIGGDSVSSVELSRPGLAFLEESD